jgi:membrane protease YdiL (CAAX protease family)
MTDPSNPQPTDPARVEATANLPNALPAIPEVVPLPPPPRRRFYPVAFLLALLAWCVVIFMIVFLVLFQSDTERRVVEATGKNNLNLLVMRAQARYLLGVREFAAKALGDATQVTAQAKALNTGTVDQRLRYVVLVGELDGPDEALHTLEKLEQLIKGKDASVTGEQQSQMEVFRRLYSDYQHQRFDAPSVSPDDRRELRQNLGWFGDLALTPAAEPGPVNGVAAIAGSPAAAGSTSVEPDQQVREAVLRPTRRVTLVALSALVVVLGFLFLGFCGLLLFIALLFFGYLRGGLACGTGPAGVYIETFALWMLIFWGLSFGVGYGLHYLYGDGPIPPRESLLASGAAMLLSLIVLFWPVVRGVPWRRVREHIGLTFGRRPAAEPVIGFGCYIMGYPLMVAGIVVMLILMGAQHLMGGGGPSSADDLVSPPSPGHPIVGPLARGDWQVRLLIFILASVVAPIVEETIFRGVLYRHLRELTCGLGAVVSIVLSGLVSSFIFAVIHPQGMLAVPVLMALACGFVLIREWRGTLIPCMIAHGLNNGLVMCVAIGMLGD